MDKVRLKITGKLILFLSNLFLVSDLSAQSFDKEYQFLQHLIKIEAYNEVRLQADLLKRESITDTRRDTLNYFLGKAYYYEKDILSSIQAFDKVSAGIPFSEESRFLKYYQQSYIGQYEEALRGWKGEDPSSGYKQAIVNFELAGLALLERDLNSYDSLNRNFTSDYFQLIKSQKNLEKFAQGIREFKHKSPFLAGLYSAVIPGSGKMYIGKIGEGLISLLTHTILGLQTYEAYRKDGIESARFIIFGSAFTAFYVGNIWGSVLSVKIRNDEFNDQINDSVLITMHVPLRILFD